MRRAVSFWESRITLSEEQQAQIRDLLQVPADEFIDRARLAGGEYKAKTAAWSGPTPAEVRQAIEVLMLACKETRAAINALPPGTEERIREGQTIDQIKATASDASGEPLPPVLARSTETELEDLETHLTRIESACRRATKSSALNQGRGKEPDYARLTFIRELGEAYTAATGKRPAVRSQGKFASVARIILTAAGTDPGISNDTLKKLFQPSGNSG